jgi:adenylate cyclase
MCLSDRAALGRTDNLLPCHSTWQGRSVVEGPMAETKVERRLTAMLALDVVGYSRLMGGDEAGTLRRLKEHRRLYLDPAVKRHGGRIVKLTGDGALAEFSSVTEALAAAAEIQCAAATVNGKLRDDQGLTFRIGIHSGDIMIDGADIYGDGVNLAARLEGIAPPGGIAVSRSVRDAVRDRLAIAFVDQGEQALKNIEKPVRVFHVTWDPAAWGDAAVGGRWSVRNSRRATYAAVAGAVIVLGGATWLIAHQQAEPPNVPSAAIAVQQKPTMAVLAFTNLSGDPAQDYFSDGVSEEILTALARSPYLTVIARNSSFIYKGKPVDVTEIGRTLGVRYVLKGSLQRADDRIRITAQLIDARTGGHLWAEKYDRPLQDIFALQDEISGTSAARLDDRIQRAETEAARRKATTDLTAYDDFLHGREILLGAASREETLHAREFFQRAIDRDPGFAPAYADLGYTYYREVARRWDPARREAAISDGIGLAERALALDPALPSAHIVMGNLVMRRADFDAAVRWETQAIALNPNDPESYAGLANVLLFMNRAEEALTLMRKALLLDPLHPPLYDNYTGRALLLSQDFAGSIPCLSECVRRLPDSWSCHQGLATAYLHMGQTDAAAREVTEMLKGFPFKSVAEWRAHSDYQDGPQTELLNAALARLGLPPG